MGYDDDNDNGYYDDDYDNDYDDDGDNDYVTQHPIIQSNFSTRN